MSTDQTWQINSDNSANTEQVAEKLAASLRGGEVIQLISDLGGGKTTFVRGLARGLGSADHVSSPTFKINNVYQGKTLTLYHYDFYRLADDTLIEHELADVINDNSAVVAMEWPQQLGSTPRDCIKIEIVALGDEKRKIIITAPKKYSYILAD